MPDGSRADLSTLLRLDERLLLVSDGAMLGEATRAQAVLRRIGAARRAVWIDEREQRFWHRFDPHRGIPGLPVWPGTAEGIQAALACLGMLTNGGPAAGMAEDSRRPLYGATLATQTAQLLGSASMWAASCAIIQPISPALAQHVRHRFFPHLPPIAFGRLVALEGSRLTQSGLSFGPAVLRYLRQEFALRLDEKRRDEMLQAIRTVVEESDPGLAGTPLQDAYAWHRAQFLLDQDLDEALPELLDLRQTALAPAIQSELQRVRLPHAEAPEGATLLLRNPSGISQLHQVAKAYDAPIAGEFVDPWRLLERTSVMELPAPGMAACQDLDVAAVLLVDGTIVLADRRRSHTSDKVPGRGVRLAISHDRTLAAVTYRDSGFLGVYSVPANVSGTPVPGSDPPVRSVASTEVDGQVTGLGWFQAARFVAIVASRSVSIFDLTRPPEIDTSLTLFAGLREETATFAGLCISPDGRTMLVGNGSELLRFQPFSSPMSGDDLGTKPRSPLESREATGTDLVRIEAIAVGDEEGAWPVAVAGSGLVQVIRKDGTRDGPWPLPGKQVASVELVDEGRTVAVLVEERLVILHARTGLDLLMDEGAEQRAHAALAASMRTAFLWGPERRSITRHGFDNATEGAQTA